MEDREVQKEKAREDAHELAKNIDQRECIRLIKMWKEGNLKEVFGTLRAHQIEIMSRSYLRELMNKLPEEFQD